MKPMPTLDDLLKKAKSKGIFGTKERSVIKQNNAEGIKAVVKQQFEVAKQVLSHGLVPIVEPEVDIKNPDKKGSEEVLKKELIAELDKLPANQQVMLKLTIPEVDNLYADLVKHPRVLKVVALSGGYSRDEANKRLAKQNGMIASFSRALSRRPHRAAERCGVQQVAGYGDREHLPGVEDLSFRRPSVENEGPGDESRRGFFVAIERFAGATGRQGTVDRKKRGATTWPHVVRF